MDMSLTCPPPSNTSWSCVCLRVLTNTLWSCKCRLLCIAFPCALEWLCTSGLGYSAPCGSLLNSHDGPRGNQSSAVLCGWWLGIRQEDETKGMREVRRRQKCLLAYPLCEGGLSHFSVCSYRIQTQDAHGRPFLFLKHMKHTVQHRCIFLPLSDSHREKANRPLFDCAESMSAIRECCPKCWSKWTA